MKQFFQNELDISYHHYAQFYSLDQIRKEFDRKTTIMAGKETKTFKKRMKYAKRVIDTLTNETGNYGFFVTHNMGPAILTTTKMYGGGIETIINLKADKIADHNKYMVAAGKLQGKRLMGQTFAVFDCADWLYHVEVEVNQKAAYWDPNGRKQKITFNPEFAKALSVITDSAKVTSFINQTLMELQKPNTTVIDVPDYLGNYLILQ